MELQESSVCGAMGGIAYPATHIVGVAMPPMCVACHQPGRHTSLRIQYFNGG